MKYSNIPTSSLIALLLILSCSILSLNAQDQVFQLYDGKGDKITFSEMMNRAATNQVFLFGEYHDQPICHWLQKEILYKLHSEKSSSLKVGMEMFESDDQLKIEEYFNGFISQSKFEAEARIWKNYKTDYKDVLEYCRENKLTFVGTNVPGRYANLVFREGIERLNDLPTESKSYMPPLPIEIDLSIPSYARLLEMGGGGHSPNGNNFPNAQALRDATMAFQILKHFTDGDYFYHLNGAYHSDDYEGINYFLKKANPTLKVFTLSTVYQNDLSELEKENQNKADVILVIHNNMTKSH